MVAIIGYYSERRCIVQIPLEVICEALSAITQ